ncbi:uncharacterized protein LOC126195714 [Schistocerca nitens]|uniref:uncharacterized protein LOC126195714 n=1 Tax=Schistocerca nitens TaxID=7011 RepID=UPI00211768BD|nr:uncharacterized protein LOC126195714 [Schistocerca nitens]
MDAHKHPVVTEKTHLHQLNYEVTEDILMEEVEDESTSERAGRGGEGRGSDALHSSPRRGPRDWRVRGAAASAPAAVESRVHSVRARARRVVADVNKPAAVARAAQWNMLRSPSHESVTTDLSLFSVSSLASEAGTGRRLVTFKSYSEAQLAAAAGGVAGAGGAPGGSAARGPSPNPDTRHSRPADIPEILWFEEETELIRSCGALSSALGLQKSFSTSDISQLPSPQGTAAARCAVSELALWGDATHARLEPASRSCSTWVAVGDVASTSQLPSPHGAPPPPVPAFTAADLIRSVNKKVRQNYIRRRLLTTYKALERLSQSEFNLDRLEVTPATAAAAQAAQQHLTVPGASTSAAVLRVVKQRATTNLPLTIRDVERERGKPLSKYERNMMIFNWLHTLDDSAFEGLQ